MRGPDITRLRNKAAQVLLLVWLGLWAGSPLSQSSWAAPPFGQSQSEQNQAHPNQAKPDSQPDTPPPSASPAVPASPAPNQDQTKKDETDKQEQDQTLREQGTYVVRKDVDEVLLHATVVDDKQHFVTTLDRSAFTVQEDGKLQKIISFHQVDIPVSMGIVIDNSGSMREKRNKVNQAALNLVRSSNPKDEVFVVNFSDEYYLDQDFTNDLLKLKEALEKIDARGGTALRDAVVASADHLRRNARLEKKVLFLVTDGDDTASTDSLEQTVKHLQEENGPTVYAIGILGGEEHPKRARRALEIMAERTGGIAFFPKTLDEVNEISRTIADDIRNQYAIGYKSTNPRSNGGFRQIRVEAKAKGHRKLIVRTKSGYYAGAQSAAPAKK